MAPSVYHRFRYAFRYASVSFRNQIIIPSRIVTFRSAVPILCRTYSLKPAIHCAPRLSGSRTEDCKSSIPQFKSGWRLQLKHRKTTRIQLKCSFSGSFSCLLTFLLPAKIDTQSSDSVRNGTLRLCQGCATPNPQSLENSGFLILAHSGLCHGTRQHTRDLVLFRYAPAAFSLDAFVPSPASAPGDAGSHTLSASASQPSISSLYEIPPARPGDLSLSCGLYFASSNSGCINSSMAKFAISTRYSLL